MGGRGRGRLCVNKRAHALRYNHIIIMTPKIVTSNNVLKKKLMNVLAS